MTNKKSLLSEIFSRFLVKIGWKLIFFSDSLRPKKKIKNQTFYYYPYQNYENIIMWDNIFYYFDKEGTVVKQIFTEEKYKQKGIQIEGNYE